ncbi:ComEA family DNA-binding protein [Legionella sp.]|uniref:ComEA family DNA-binding protein n=1 Tax=Legionella sp. TaxID=459 RepID=UPI003CB7B20E
MKTTFMAAALVLAVTTFTVHASSITPQKVVKKQTVGLSDKINLNKANLSLLIGSFKGIGKKRAEAIIAYRESHQGFKSIEELAEVKGIGQHFVVANREKLNEIFAIQ